MALEVIFFFLQKLHKEKKFNIFLVFTHVMNDTISKTHLGFHWVSKVMHVTNLFVSYRLLSHELLVSGEYNALLMYLIGMAV